nr:unnamed protein product [Callosobruchus analis]
MEKYINEILVTVQELADMGKPIDDKSVAFIMMNGVMEEYEALISSLNQSDEKLTAEKVKITVLNESERRRVKSNQVSLSNSKSALLVNKEHRQKKFKKKIFKCYNCGYPNYKKPNCPKLRISSQTSKRPDTQGKPRTFLTKLQDSQLDWLINSGAASHMWSKELLSNLTEQDVQIAVADYSTMKCFGVGEVQVDLDIDGQKDTKVITNVMYVPSLSTNLVSVSRVTKKGYCVVFDEMSCKVYNKNNFDVKGNLEATGMQKDGLYSLNMYYLEPVTGNVYFLYI